MKLFSFEVLTVEKSIFSGEIASLVVKASDGELGVLCDHAPIITPLVAGNIRFKRSDGKDERLSLSEDGLLIVNKNRATILL
jgi:F-type H+-transporting ATPase subunit epsilon